MKKWTLVKTILGTAAVVLSIGCSASLRPGNISTIPSEDSKGEIAVEQTAQNMRANIGYITCTVFAIPCVPVQAENALMDQIRYAVEQAGYKARMVQSASDAGGMPVLSCKVNKFKFKNYTWFFPLVFNWGTINLDIVINGSDGQVLWNKQYEGKATGFYSYDITVNKALNKILNLLSADLADVNISGS